MIVGYQKELAVVFPYNDTGTGTAGLLAEVLSEKAHSLNISVIYGNYRRHNLFYNLSHIGNRCLCHLIGDKLLYFSYLFLAEIIIGNGCCSVLLIIPNLNVFLSGIRLA